MEDFKPVSINIPVKNEHEKAAISFYTALSKAQSEFPQILKNKEVSFSGRSYGYADLGSIISAVTPALTMNGFSFYFLIEERKNDTVYLVAVLAHKDGEKIYSSIPINLQQNPQVFGSQYSYYRRYLLCGLLNISAEDDDDGESAKKKSESPNQPSAPEVPSQVSKGAGGSISEAQRKRMYAIGKTNGFTDDQMKALTMSFGYEHSKDIQKSDYEEICKELERGPQLSNNMVGGY